MGVALAPIASIMATDRSDCCTRTFMPFMSATLWIGLGEYMDRAPLSYQARPTKPACSQDFSIWSPMSLSSTLCRCSVDVNRNGSDGTRVTSQMLCMAALLTRAMARAPSLTCSIESFSLPSAPPENTLTVMRPLLRSWISSPIFLTASTVG